MDSFKQFFEQSDPEQVKAVAEKIFGPALPSKMWLSWRWDFDDGRELRIRYDHGETPGVYIVFDKEHQPGQSGDKEFNTMQQVQPGSVDFARRLKLLAQELKKIGVAVKYVTSGRRENIYSKFLQKAGLNRMPGTGFVNLWK